MNHVNTNEELFYTNWHAADKWRRYRLVFHQIKTFHSQLKTENVSKVEEHFFFCFIEKFLNCRWELYESGNIMLLCNKSA